MVFAAGLGTRLAPLTDARPKPAVPLANRPLVAYALEHVASEGISDVSVNTHYMSEIMEKNVCDASGDRVRLSVSRERRLLGTAGGVRQAMLGRGAPQTVVTVNADVLYRPSLATALAEHHRVGAFATMIVRATDRSDQARVGVDREGRIRGILHAGDGRVPRYQFTGVQILSPAALAQLPAEGCLVRAGYIPWLHEGRHLAGVVDDSPFWDVGDLAAYASVSRKLATGALSWPGVPAPTAEGIIHPDAIIEPGARLIGATVGAGAVVPSGVTVEDAIVWDGVRVESHLSGAVATERGVYRLPSEPRVS